MSFPARERVRCLARFGVASKRCDGVTTSVRTGQSGQRGLHVLGVISVAVIGLGTAAWWYVGQSAESSHLLTLAAYSPALEGDLRRTGADYGGYRPPDPEELRRRRPVPLEAAHLFRRSGKGPRADLYTEENVLELRKGPSRVVAAISPATADRLRPIAGAPARVNRAAKADRLPLVPEKRDEGAAQLTAAFGLPFANSVDSLLFAGPLRLPGQMTPAVFRPTREDPRQAIRQAALVPRLFPSGRAFGGLTEAEFRRRELRCMATAIYFEARGEPERGQIAVAQVIMNRVRAPDYPDTICGVIFQGAYRRGSCQFSFACDGRPDKPRNAAQWETAKRLAKLVTEGRVWLQDIGYSTHYHATYVSPKWRRHMRRIKRIGRHIFYKAPKIDLTQTYQKVAG